MTVTDTHMRTLTNVVPKGPWNVTGGMRVAATETRDGTIVCSAGPAETDEDSINNWQTMEYVAATGNWVPHTLNRLDDARALHPNKKGRCPTCKTVFPCATRQALDADPASSRAGRGHSERRQR